MARFWWSLLLLTACGGEINVNDNTDTDVADVDDEPDYSAYEGAVLRIAEPRSGDFVPWQQSSPFAAELTSAEGEPLDLPEEAEVVWTSSVDPAWAPVDLAFDDDTIDIGRHDLTVEVLLPTGDRLAHTVGGVLVQSDLAGTYVGTLSASVQVEQLPLACAGGAVLVVDPLGELVTGGADCLARAGDFELPLDFEIDAEQDAGVIEGEAIAEIIAFPVEFPAEGELDAGEERISLTFGGDVFGNELDGRIRVERLNRDAGL